MNKRKLHHFWTKFKLIRPWYVLILFLISSGISVYALRQNNITMISLRNDVYRADKSNANVEQALVNLQSYVVSHMNTNLTTGNSSVYPPIQLSYTYERLVEASQAQSQAVNTQIYTNAQTYCQKINPTDFSGHNRVPCIEQYVQSHGIIVPNLSPSLYEFDFVSPTWSPDLAGWALLTSAILLLAFIGLVIVRMWFNRAEL
jgi:hypothetical protein